MDEDQAGPDPEESRGALARRDPEPTHDEFMADLYPKNLEDAFTIKDQFINDKSTKDEPKKPSVVAEVVSMVTVPIYQASSSVPPISTPIPMIDLSPPKPASSTTQEPSGSYKSVPEHIALYEALEASMELAQRDQFLAEKDKSRKRRRDDQYPPPSPPSDLYISKKRGHDTDASGSSQPQASYVSDLKDTNSTHLPKTKQRPEWFKPILDDDIPATPEPNWVIPTSHIPDAANNKGTGQALSISKMKAARNIDFDLELLVPKHIWINE
nr:hypothetical protein [Tanacetum cinerariifolium]